MSALEERATTANRAAERGESRLVTGGLGLVPDAGGGVGTMVRLGFVPGVAALGALFAHQAAMGAARPTTAFDHVAFTVAALVGAGAVVGVLRPRTTRRGGGIDR
jgi:hypothetical protein